jgi:ADP-heptose:LPS heptosyltransferase
VSVSGLASETVDLGVSKSGDQEWVFAFKSLIRLVRFIRRGEFDLLLGFSSGLETQIGLRMGRSGRLVMASRTPYLLDYLFGSRTGPRRTGDHAAACASVMNQLGIDIGPEQSLIVLPTEENKRFEELLARHGSKGGEPIVVLYGSSAVARRVGAIACLVDVAGRLVNNFGARIVAVDEPSSRSFTDRIAASLPPGAIRLASPRALEAAAAIARASLVISNEADLVNLTSEFRTPMLEIRNTRGRSDPDAGHRVVSGAPGIGLADDVFEVASEMLQRSRFPSLFQ